MEPSGAGGLLAVHNLAQLVSALVLPALADRLADPRPAVVSAVAATALGSGWLSALPDVLPWVAATVVGLGLGGGFSLALVLVADFAADPAAAGRLVAMVFLIGYTAAAVAPVLVGALRDLTGGFAVPFGLLTMMALLQVAVGDATGSRPSEHPRLAGWRRTRCSAAAPGTD